MKLMIMFSGGQYGNRVLVSEAQNFVPDWAAHLYRLCDEDSTGTKFAFVPPEDWQPAQEDTITGEGDSQPDPVVYEITNWMHLPNCTLIRARSSSESCDGVLA